MPQESLTLLKPLQLDKFGAQVEEAICNEERKFLDLFVGFPGLSHDSWVFENSFICPKLSEACGDYIILGDSAHGCRENLFTPYRDNGHLTRLQKTYNKRHSSCRVMIEHSFGILRQRFRQLYYCKLRGMEKLCHFVRACCVLHNLASESDLDFEYNDPEPEVLRIQVPEDSAAGRRRRDDYCRNLEI